MRKRIFLNGTKAKWIALYTLKAPKNLKPIFHCNAKPLTLGPRVGLDPQREILALGIPTCWYLKTLAGQTWAPCGPNAKPHGPNVSPHGPNASRWNIGRIGSPRIGAGVGHVHFKLFMSISFALDSQRKYWWNMGLNVKWNVTVHFHVYVHSWVFFHT